MEFRGTDGKTARPFGDHPSGVLTYDQAGNVTAQIMGSDRKRFASDDTSKATAEEAISAVRTFISYFGRYDVDEKETRVTHHILGSVFPNWTGGDQVRFFSFSKDRLALTTPPLPFGGEMMTAVLEWEKIG